MGGSEWARVIECVCVCMCGKENGCHPSLRIISFVALSLSPFFICLSMFHHLIFLAANPSFLLHYSTTFV